ncbi:MAG: PD-(D/E)XK nuclease family transposase, partial [Ruminococcus callidus]|nr:PD-(D/E)XK nuclease family transposase [Ruminococcus callidus]
DEYYSSYKILEESRHNILTDKFSIVFFELKKLKNARKNKPVEVWLDLINAETEGDLEMIESATNVKDIHDIIFTIREMSADEKIRYEAEMREKAIMDERSALTNSERRGFKKGIEKGRAIGIEEGKIRGKVEIVDNLVSNMGFDLESALKAASITEEQYNEYKCK